MKLLFASSLALVAVILCTTGTLAQNNSLCPDDISYVDKQDLVHLNQLLSFKYLELAFFNNGLSSFNSSQVVNDNFTASDYARWTTIRDQKSEQIDRIVDAINDLEGTPVQACQYQFDFSSFSNFLDQAGDLENTGVGAYVDNAVNYFGTSTSQLVGGIATVDARHASWLLSKNGQDPFPDAVDAPLNSSQVADAISQYGGSCPDFNTQCYGESGDGACSGHGSCGAPDLCLCLPGWGGPLCDCEAGCQLCDSPNQCCNDVSKGYLCYSPSDYHCPENENGDNVLCGLGAGACGTICYDTQYYDCDEEGSLVPIASQFPPQEQRVQEPEFIQEAIHIMVPPKENDSDRIAVSLLCMIVCAIIALL